MDFSENFSFVLQDEAHGYHWAHGCGTLLLCYMWKTKTMWKFFVFPADMEHDKSMVYQSEVNDNNVHFVPTLLIFHLNNPNFDFKGWQLWGRDWFVICERQKQSEFSDWTAFNSW